MPEAKVPEELKKQIRFSEVYRAVKQTIPDVKYSELEIAMKDVDLDRLYTEALERVVVKEWKGEPLGRAKSAEEVRRAHRLSEGDKAYLVFVDGKLTLFQPMNPFNPLDSRLTEKNIKKVMDQHRQKVAFELMRREMIEEIIKTILRMREEREREEVR